MTILKKVLLAMTIMSTPAFGSDFVFEESKSSGTSIETVQPLAALTLPEGVRLGWDQSVEKFLAMSDDQLVGCFEYKDQHGNILDLNAPNPAVFYYKDDQENVIDPTTASTEYLYQDQHGNFRRIENGMFVSFRDRSYNVPQDSTVIQMTQLTTPEYEVHYWAGQCLQTQFTYTQAPAWIALQRGLPTQERTARAFLALGQYKNLANVGDRIDTLDFILKHVSSDSELLKTIKQEAKKELLALANFTNFPKPGTSRVTMPTNAAIMYYNYAENDAQRALAIEALARYAKGDVLYNGEQKIDTKYLSFGRVKASKFLANEGYATLAKETLMVLISDCLKNQGNSWYEAEQLLRLRDNDDARINKYAQEILINMLSNEESVIASGSYTYENLIQAATILKNLFPDQQDFADLKIEEFTKNARVLSEFKSFVASANRPLTLKDLNERIAKAHKVYQLGKSLNQELFTTDLFKYKENENNARGFIARDLLGIDQNAPLTQELIENAFQNVSAGLSSAKLVKFVDAKAFLNSTLQQN